MKKLLAVFGLTLGLVGISHAGTPQETYFQGQAPLSGNTILVSSASTSSANITLVVSTPTAVNSGGGTYTGRNCFTRFVVQVSTAATFTVKDNNATVWTFYGLGIGASGVNTLSLPEDHLGPLCTAAGDQTSFVITNSAGSNLPESINVEGYTTYGGTLNAGVMQ